MTWQEELIMAVENRVQPEYRPAFVTGLILGLHPIPTPVKSTTPGRQEPIYLDFKKNRILQGKNTSAIINMKQGPWKIARQFEEFDTVHFLSIFSCGSKPAADALHRFQTDTGKFISNLKSNGASAIRVRIANAPGCYRLKHVSYNSNIREAKTIVEKLDRKECYIDPKALANTTEQLKKAFDLHPTSLAASVVVAKWCREISRADTNILKTAWPILIDTIFKGYREISKATVWCPPPKQDDTIMSAIQHYLADKPREIAALCLHAQRIERIAAPLAIFPCDLLEIVAQLLNMCKTSNSDIQFLKKTDLASSLIAQATQSSDLPHTMSRKSRELFANSAIGQVLTDDLDLISLVRLSADQIRQQLLVRLLRVMRARSSQHQPSAARQVSMGHHIDKLPDTKGPKKPSDEMHEEIPTTPPPDLPPDDDDYESRQDTIANDDAWRDS